MMIKREVAVRRNAMDVLEMDNAIFDALRDYEVGFHLIPLPKQKAADTKSTSSSSYQAAAPPPAPYGSHPYQKSGGRKGENRSPPKGKGKSKQRPTNILPAPLQNKDCVGVGPHGRRLCFDYNIGGWDACRDGAAPVLQAWMSCSTFLPGPCEVDPGLTVSSRQLPGELWRDIGSMRGS